MDKIILLTKAEYSKLKGHTKNPKRNNLVCRCCKLRFVIGDILLKDSGNYIHQSCESKYRFDIPDSIIEPGEEDNFFIIKK